MSTGAMLAHPRTERPAAPKPAGAVVTARVVLWLAALVPFIYSTSHTAASLAAGGGVGPLEMVRGAGPAVLWAASLLLAPTLRRGVGVVEIALGGFAVVIVLSVLIPGNPSPQGSLLKAVSMVFVLLALGRLARMYATPKDAVSALIGFVHLVLVAALVQVVLFRSVVYAVDPNSADGLARLNSLVPQVSANPLALVAVAGVLSCILGVGPRWLPSGPVVRNVLVVLYLYLIVLTRTRSALAVGLVIVAIALLLRAKRRPLSTLAIMAALVAATVLVLPSVLPEVHSFLQRGQTAQGIDTLSGRTVVWDYAWNVWQHNKMFGLGYYTGHRLGIEGLSQTQSNIDNTWLETMVDVGLLGLIPLALFAVSGLVRLLRSRELTGDWKLWAVGVALYVIAISFVNPTIQTTGAGGLVLTFLLLLTLPPTGAARPNGAAPQDAPDGVGP